MGVDSERFRKRSKECRDLAAHERDETMRTTLLQIAQDLEAEADMIEAEERTPDA